LKLQIQRRISQSIEKVRDRCDLGNSFFYFFLGSCVGIDKNVGKVVEAELEEVLKVYFYTRVNKDLSSICRVS